MSNIEVVRGIYAAFGSGDVPTILNHLTDDVAWDQDAPSYGLAMFEPGTGKAHVQRFFESLAAVEFLRFEPLNFLTGGNQVAVPLRLSVKVKGKVMEALEIHLFTFDDGGKVTRFFHCLDRHAFVLAFQA